MEEVPGIPGSIPILPEYPPQSTVASLPPVEWQACLDTWIFCVEFRLRILPDQFRCFKLSRNASGIPFLLSYFRSQSARVSSEVNTHQGAALKLHKSCYFLLRRLLLDTEGPYDCDSLSLFNLLAAASVTLKGSLKFPNLLHTAWKRSSQELSKAVDVGKQALVAELFSVGPKSGLTVSSLRQASSLVSSSPEAGKIFMTGSDYLETLLQSFDDSRGVSNPDSVHRALTENIFICLRSLLKPPLPNMSLLLDHLYILKSSADKSPKEKPTLLSNLVCLTTFINQLDITLAATPQSRGKQLLSSLQTYRERTSHLHPLPPVRRSKSGKAKDKAKSGGEMHTHKASKISQIHDLFPDLPVAYILRLLNHFKDDVETVIAALLEKESLPDSLQEPKNEDKEETAFEQIPPDLAPRSTPPPSLPQKRNVFDNDNFDKLQISSFKLHRGRKDILTEVPSTEDQHSRSKAAIMAALAAFDSDDDERDDTYDVADVGGTVDDAFDTDARSNTQGRPQNDNNEELLYRAWKSSPDLFARDSKNRLSQPRTQLKRDTNMTDEQLEGWGLMLSRDTMKQIRLDRKYLTASSYSGRQSALGPSRWSAPQSGTATEEEDSDIDPNVNRGTSDLDEKRGGAQIRGGRGLGRGRGGYAGGPADEHGTQVARKRKEQGRGRGGANHNRREGRAKKIDRGMGGPVG